MFVNIQCKTARTLYYIKHKIFKYQLRVIKQLFGRLLK